MSICSHVHRLASVHTIQSFALNHAFIPTYLHAGAFYPDLAMRTTTLHSFRMLYPPAHLDSINSGSKRVI
eukprot:1259803-Pleurochrysis_carterae.AAC.1